MCDLIFVAHPLKTEFYFVFPVTCFRREGGLCKKGFQVPCMDGFSVCQCFRIFSTFSPDSFLRLVTHSFIFSGVIFFTSTSLLLPPTKGEKKYILAMVIAPHKQRLCSCTNPSLRMRKLNYKNMCYAISAGVKLQARFTHEICSTQSHYRA